MSNVKVKLLIVDDDRSLRMSLSQLFTELGHSVRSAEDSSSALLEIREEVPEMILSDLNMPGIVQAMISAGTAADFPAGSSDVPMTASDEASVSTSRGFPRLQVR
jgi:CheY-like chemotaxis protein